MKTRHYFLSTAAVISLVPVAVLAQTETDAPMTFFVTSEAHSRQFSADSPVPYATCQRLAAAEGA